MIALWLSAALLGVLAALVWMAQRLGRARAERDFNEDAGSTVWQAMAIEDRVGRLAGDELDRELRPWRRSGVPLGQGNRPGPRGHPVGGDETPDPRP
jgi:hypothetical protein